MRTVRLRQIFLLILVACVSYVLVRLFAEAFTGGGTAWQQGDWLINSHEVWVRRGPFGSLVLAVSDLVALNPAQVVMLLQGMLLVVTAATLGRVALKIDQASPLWLLVMSPGFFPIFWAADFSGGLRKELITYCAMALLLWGAFGDRPARALRLAAVVLFVLAMIGHESNILLAPAFVAVFVLTRPTATDGARPLLGRGDIPVIAIVGFAAVVGMGFAVRFMSVEDVGLICAPLLERGLYPGICTGVIETLADDIPSVWGYGFERTSLEGAQFVLSYLVITGFFALLAYQSSDWKLIWIVYVALLAVLLPLYPISNDWGRWLNMHVSCVIFVTLALMLSGRVTFRPVSASVLLLSAATSLFWAPAHTWGMREWGVMGQVGKILGLL